MSVRSSWAQILTPGVASHFALSATNHIACVSGRVSRVLQIRFGVLHFYVPHRFLVVMLHLSIHTYVPDWTPRRKPPLIALGNRSRAAYNCISQGNMSAILGKLLFQFGKYAYRFGGNNFLQGQAAQLSCPLASFFANQPAFVANQTALFAVHTSA